MNPRRTLWTTLIFSAAIVLLASCGKSSSSTAPDALDSTPPAAPSNIGSSYDANLQVDYLTWTPSSSADVSSYEIYQYNAFPVTGATGVALCSAPAAASSIALPGTPDAGAFYYRVRAKDAAGNTSPFSAAVQVTRHATSQQSPTAGDDADPHAARTR